MKNLSVLIAVLSAALVGCPSTTAYQAIPLEDARALNSHLTAFSSSTRDIVEEANLDVQRVGTVPAGISTDQFEVDLFRSALVSCFNADLEIDQLTTDPPRSVSSERGPSVYPLTQRPDLGNVSPCDVDELISLESYVDHAPDRIGEYMVDRVLMVDSLRVNLKHVLQERLNLLAEYVIDGENEVARLREDSRLRYDNNLNADGVTNEQRLQTEADFENLQNILDEIDDLLESIEDDLGDLRAFRRQLVEDVAVQLAGLGV